MFDFAWSEIAVIALVALVVIGPKDLPRVLRTLGIWVGRARAIAREFQGSLDQMIREAELEDVRKQVEEAASLDLGHEIGQAIDPGGELQKSLSEPLEGTSTVPPPDAIPDEPTAALPPPTPEEPPAVAEAETAPPGEAQPVAAAPSPSPDDKAAATSGSRG